VSRAGRIALLGVALLDELLHEACPRGSWRESGDQRVGFARGDAGQVEGRVATALGREREDPLELTGLEAEGYPTTLRLVAVVRDSSPVLEDGPVEERT